MNANRPSTSFPDPLQTLGLDLDAGPEEIRARYLALVKEFPPERDPDRFQEIQSAFQIAEDPLVLADRLLEPPSDTPPDWEDVIAEQTAQRPEMSVDFLLSLGNRDEGFSSTDEDTEPPR